MRDVAVFWGRSIWTCVGCGVAAAALSSALATADDKTDPTSAEQSSADTSVLAIDMLPSLDVEGLAATTPTLSWHERFTFSGATGSGIADFNADTLSDDLAFTPGMKWGFTLSFEDDPDAEAFDIDELRAGAFYNLTPRMRIGGELSFTSPDEALILGPASDEDEEPEIKLESAFRF